MRRHHRLEPLPILDRELWDEAAEEGPVQCLEALGDDRLTPKPQRGDDHERD
ncbi:MULTISPECIES: hypothetical protein [Brevundimonas]|uniref:hypothetical protein n=1 Tax=Brevundimonas TaxID=41275 RepID=UPI0013CEA448|nr:hypothetical protein [Brevundimonas lutea]